MNAFSLGVGKTVGTFSLQFALFMVALTWIQLFEVISGMKNPVPWFAADPGTFGYWWSSRSGNDQ